VSSRTPVAGSQAHSVRYPEIDVAKGIAILCVLLIHAEPLAGNLVHEYLFNRAVPVLLVLFGAASELWWHRACPSSSALGCGLRFVRARMSRLLPPVWAALGVWWGLRLIASPAAAPEPAWLVPHALGYIPQVGTGWFVTLIVQLVLCYPLLRWLLVRCGVAMSLLLTAAIHAWSQLYVFDVVDLMRGALQDSAHMHGFFVFYYSWIFAPARLLLVLSGMLLARCALRPSRGVLLLCAAAWALGCFTHPHLTDRVQQSALLSVLDVPLALLWLLAARAAHHLAGAALLGWLGRESWGVYLGQLLVHTSAGLLGYEVLRQPVTGRFAYAGLLLAGGMSWVLLGDAVRALTRSEPQPAPEPAEPRLADAGEPPAS